MKRTVDPARREHYRREQIRVLSELAQLAYYRSPAIACNMMYGIIMMLGSGVILSAIAIMKDRIDDPAMALMTIHSICVTMAVFGAVTGATMGLVSGGGLPRGVQPFDPARNYARTCESQPAQTMS